MKFGICKWKILFIRRGKMIDTDDIEMPDRKRMKQVEEDGYKYLGMVQDSQIKTAVMKEMIKKEYFRRVGQFSNLVSYMRYAVRFATIYLCYSKNLKNAHRVVLLLVNLQALACNFTKSNTHLWEFLYFLFFRLYKRQQRNYIESREKRDYLTAPNKRYVIRKGQL